MRHTYTTCDRCGSRIEVQRAFRFWWKRGAIRMLYDPYAEWELCRICLKDLVAWLERFRKEPRG
jgi:hypothetical protein